MARRTQVYADELDEALGLEEQAAQAEAARVKAERESYAATRAMRDRYGTTNRDTIRAVAGRGPFRENFGALAKVDPSGMAAELAEVEGLLGLTPPADTGAPERQFRVGRGAQGEPYFTNLTNDELRGERRDRDAILGVTGGDEPIPVRDLKPLSYGQGGDRTFDGGGTVSNLGGRVGAGGRFDERDRIIDEAHTVLDRPVRLARKGAELRGEAEKRGREIGAIEAMAELDDALATGVALERGYREQDVLKAQSRLAYLARNDPNFPVVAEDVEDYGGEPSRLGTMLGAKVTPQAAARAAEDTAIDDLVGTTEGLPTAAGGAQVPPAPAQLLEASARPEPAPMRAKEAMPTEPRSQRQRVGGATLGYEIGGPLFANVPGLDFTDPALADLVGEGPESAMDLSGLTRLRDRLEGSGPRSRRARERRAAR